MSHKTHSFDNLLFNTTQIISYEARIENQRTLDMFVTSKNIINDTGKSNKYDNHYVNVNYVYLHSDESHFCSQTWHHCCCFPEFAVTMHLCQHLKL